MSLRRVSIDLQVNRKTVVRKFLFLAQWAKALIPTLNRQYAPSETIEFDELETFEHTKCKPLSVPMAVDSKSRRVLDFRVAEMPAKGPLSHISRKKYGRRRDERRNKRKELYEELKDLITADALIKSDENPHYINEIAKEFPSATHRRYKGKRGCTTGQGELKKVRFDPLFTLNHTYAMFRANINRLIRKTWCTTKKKERLELHIALYVLRHNMCLI